MRSPNHELERCRSPCRNYWKIKDRRRCSEYPVFGLVLERGISRTKWTIAVVPLSSVSVWRVFRPQYSVWKVFLIVLFDVSCCVCTACVVQDELPMWTVNYTTITFATTFPVYYTLLSLIMDALV
jgi:hypothetical protein